MNYREKAQELVEWFLNEGLHKYGRYQSSDVEDLIGAKFSATKVVDEIISITFSTPTDYGASWTYWNQVKREIEKL